MLSLEPPYYDIGGILVYRDHAVGNLFYYAAPEPKISRAAGRLMFDLMMYSVELEHSVLSGTRIPEELGAGFLTMGVDCALMEAKKLALRQGLEGLTGVPADQISLYPIPYHKGSVRVLALDRFNKPGEAQASPASETPTKGRPTFVEQIIGSSTPALLGDLRAIFSLALSQQGVAFLEGLYRDGAAPVGVVYELAFYGLRPAVDVEITANLSRIHTHFGGGLSGQYQWFKADISAGIDYLVERNDIQIRLVSQAVGEEAQKSKELALSLFKDQIIQQLFRPTTTPSPSPQSAASDLGSIIGNLTNTGSIGLTLKAQMTTELRTAVYRYNEQSPEERTHCPQGFLPLLLRPGELQEQIHRIDLDNAFFETLQVLVTGPQKEEFDALNIRQVEAKITYGTPSDPVPPESASLLFRPDSSGDKTFAVKRRNRKSLSYSYALIYEFARKTGVDTDSFHYEIPAKTSANRSLRISPYDDFGVLDVEVAPGTIHPDVKEVRINLSCETEDQRFRAEEHFRLNPAAPPFPPFRWQVRTKGESARKYIAQCTYLFQDNAVFDAPPQEFTDPLLRVDTPFSRDRQLLIRPVVLSQQVTQLLLELDYQDTQNRYERTFQLTFEPPFNSRTFSWPILNLNQQTVRYRVTTFETGFVTEGEWKETSEPSLIIGAAESRVATVEVRLIGPALPEAGLDALQVRLKLALAGQPEDEEQSLFYDGTQTSQSAKFPLPPGASLHYRYQTTAFKTDGQVVDSVWKESNNQMLIISTRNL
jgi:hypothetical protein